MQVCSFLLGSVLGQKWVFYYLPLLSSPYPCPLSILPLTTLPLLSSHLHHDLMTFPTPLVVFTSFSIRLLCLLFNKALGEKASYPGERWMLNQLMKGWCDYYTVVTKHGHGSLMSNIVFPQLPIPAYSAEWECPCFPRHVTITILKINSPSFISFPCFPKTKTTEYPSVLLGNIYFQLYPSFLHSCTLT